MAADDVCFRPAFLSEAEQKAIVAVVRAVDPGFYTPVLRTGARMNLVMNCLGWHWSAVSYRYSKTRDVDDREVAAVPDLLRDLARRAVRETNYWRGPDAVPDYDICIANWYDEAGGKLGLHRDDSETATSLKAGYPVVSLSIGATAIFTLGGLDRKDPRTKYRLESGDLILFGRSLRLAYHGVTRILPGTTPPALGLARPGRLNLTFRIR
jgi:alkylated DNA repair protein (DNA oxidative demethylase)